MALNYIKATNRIAPPPPPPSRSSTPGGLALRPMEEGGGARLHKAFRKKVRQTTGGKRSERKEVDEHILFSALLTCIFKTDIFSFSSGKPRRAALTGLIKPNCQHTASVGSRLNPSGQVGTVN